MYASLWQTQWRETTGRSLLVAAGPGESSAPRHPRRADRDAASRSGAGVRRLSPVGQRVGPLPTRRGALGPARPPARPAAGLVAEALPSRDGGPPADRSLPRSAQAALHALDSRSRTGSHRAALPGTSVGLDRGAVPGPVGVHAAETRAAGLRTGSGGGAALAAPGVSRDPGTGSSRTGRDSLGRRDGAAFGPPGGHLLRTTRQDARDPWNGQTLPLQHALDDHQPGQAGVHGLQGTVHSARLPPLPATPGTAATPEGLRDRGPSPSPRLWGCRTLGETAETMAAALLLARLQPRAQSR